MAVSDPTQAALRGIPTVSGVVQVDPERPPAASPTTAVGGQGPRAPLASVASPAISCCPTAGATIAAHEPCRLLRGGGSVSRRLTRFAGTPKALCRTAEQLTSTGTAPWVLLCSLREHEFLTVLPLRQAGLLGGLHRAAPVPFRGSSFTAGEHPPAATPQGRIACLYKRWSYGGTIRSFLSCAFMAHR